MSDILSESAAKQRWCPLSRAWSEATGPDQGFAAASVNRHDSISMDNRCIARQCMAWRTVYSEAAGEPRGFCGAFGKPIGS